MDVIAVVQGGEAGGVPPDTAFDVVADGQRRQVLRVLSRIDTAEHLAAITRYVAMETDRDGDVERIRARLVHCHVPKLRDAGLVSYDEERRMVELTDRGDALAEALDQ